MTPYGWIRGSRCNASPPRGNPAWTAGGPYAPRYGPGVNVTATPTPAGMREAFGSSPTVPPATGWINASNDSGNLWGGYPDEIATAGNSYLWIEALNAGGAVIGLLVTGPYTVT